MALKEKFKNPGKDFRGSPFWSWNDDLKDEELIRQIREMKDKGMGGFFMHARVGRITPYLSREWMDRIKTCVQEAKKIGMNAWLYDEDGWPSGFAGGKVVAKNKNYRLKLLEIKRSRGKGKKYSFSFIYAPYADNWLFEGFCYIDTLNPEAVDAFIESTHEAYYKEVGKEFGKTVPGIFTDEPNYIHHPGYKGKGYLFPWTDKFPAYFKKKNGYDIREHLINLIDEIGSYHKIRYDYWRAITELFIESYSKRIYYWCERHNLKYTGHYMCEDSLRLQIKWIGAAMPHYEYMHIPGIDHLNRQIGHHLLTIKQVSSVAHQLGRERVLSELYGCSGWDLSFEGQKWIGDWEYALGINFRCQHLCLYTLRGCRKRDYPPSIYYQQPWWKYHKKIADYFARLSLMLSQGKFACDILVLHPIESAWSIYTPRSSEKVDKLNKSFFNLSQFLCELHQDYDYGDEGLMEKYAQVKGDKLIVGEMEYKLVIVPPAITLRGNTFNLLKRFLRGGGKIIAVKPLPYLIEGEESEQLQTFFKNKGMKIIGEGKAILKKTLSEMLPASVEMVDERGKDIGKIYYHQRKIGNKRIYFFANIDREKSFCASIKIEGEGYLEEWDLDTGEIRPLPSSVRDGYTLFTLSFAPVESHLVVLRPGEEREKVVEKEKELKLTETITLKNIWNIQRLDPNALTLDYCQYQMGEKRWSKNMPVWKVQKKIKERGKEGIQVKLRYHFELQTESGKGKSIYLVLETPEKYVLKVNGREVAPANLEDWWVDISFKKIDIAEAVKRGGNIIELSYDYKEDVELESCYLIGDFGVEVKDNKKFVLVGEKDRLKTGDWVKQGYPFFAGTIAYTQKGKVKKNGDERIFIELDKVKGIVIKVIINGREIGLLAWPPYRLEVTEAMRDGENEIRIEVTNSLRNLLGPHHHKEGELISVGPGSWSDEANWVDEYNFVKCGLLGRVKLCKYMLTNPINS